MTRVRDWSWTKAVLVGALVAVPVLAGCSTGSSPTTATTTARAVTSAAAPPPAATTAPVVSSTPPASTPPSTPKTSPTHTAGTSAVPPANTCKNLTIRVLQGGAVQQAEIAAVTFVNSSAQACSISGYPSVVLLHNGATLATATPKSGTVAQAVRLAPGGQAESRITDHSTCNADLSDTIEVTAPNGAAGGKLTRPFQLRGCKVDVAPVKASS